MSDLTIISVMAMDDVGGFTESMIKSVKRFSSTPPQFILCNNGITKSLRHRLRLEPDVRVISGRIDPSISSSVLHGEGLNQALKNVKTKRFAIVEPDCVILKQNWDLLLDKQHKLLACKKGVGDGGESYYHVAFLLGETAAFRGIDFRPIEGKTFSISGGKGIYNDTGWSIYKHVMDKDVMPLEMISFKSGKAKYFTDKGNLKYKSSEFWFGGSPIAAHFWRGSRVFNRPTIDGVNHVEQKNEWVRLVEKIVR